MQARSSISTLSILLALFCLPVRAIPWESVVNPKCPERIIAAAQTVIVPLLEESSGGTLEQIRQGIGSRGGDEGLEWMARRRIRNQRYLDEALMLLHDHGQEIETLAQNRAQAMLGDQTTTSQVLNQEFEVPGYIRGPSVFDDVADIPLADFGDESERDVMQSILESQAELMNQGQVISFDGVGIMQQIGDVRMHELLDEAVHPSLHITKEVAALTHARPIPAVIVVRHQKAALQTHTARALSTGTQLRDLPVLIFTGWEEDDRLVSAELKEQADLIRMNELVPGHFGDIRISSAQIHYFGQVEPEGLRHFLYDLMRMSMADHPSVEIILYEDHVYGVWEEPLRLDEALEVMGMDRKQAIIDIADLLSADIASTFEGSFEEVEIGSHHVSYSLTIPNGEERRLTFRISSTTSNEAH